MAIIDNWFTIEMSLININKDVLNNSRSFFGTIWKTNTTKITDLIETNEKLKLYTLYQGALVRSLGGRRSQQLIAKNNEEFTLDFKVGLLRTPSEPSPVPPLALPLPTPFCAPTPSANTPWFNWNNLTEFYNLNCVTYYNIWFLFRLQNANKLYLFMLIKF